MVCVRFDCQLISKLYEVVPQYGAVFMPYFSEILLDDDFENSYEMLIATSLSFNDSTQLSKTVLSQSEPFEHLAM